VLLSCNECNIGPKWNNIILVRKWITSMATGFECYFKSGCLYPNCHSQTSTFAGRNKKSTTNICQVCATESPPTLKGADHAPTETCPTKLSSNLKRRKVERPTKEELLALIKTHTFTAIGTRYGVSDNAIRKWCCGYNLHTSRKAIKSI